MLVLLLHVFNAIYRDFTEPEWIAQSGIIEESAILRGHDSIHVTIRYKFYVHDQPYWGNDSVWCRDETDAARKLESYPVGVNVDIEFHPNDPETQSRLAA